MTDRMTTVALWVLGSCMGAILAMALILTIVDALAH